MMVEIPVAYKAVGVLGTATGMFLAQLTDLLPSDGSTLALQGGFVGFMYWATRTVVKTIQQTKTEIVSAKDQQIATLEARIDFLTEQLDLKEAEVKKAKASDDAD